MLYSKTGRLYDLKVASGYVSTLDKWQPGIGAIYYFHAYYDLHQGIKILDSLDAEHWYHLRNEPTAKFLYENCNETFTYTLAHDLKNVVEQKGIQTEKIFVIVMDEVHRKFLSDRLAELNIVGITIGVYNDLLKKTVIPDTMPITTKKFSALSRNYRAWRLHVYAALARKNLLHDFTYSFYNIFPYGEVKHYTIETMRKDLADTGFGEIEQPVEDWLSKVPYTLDDPEDNVMNKWNDATYNCVLSADFHLLVETHYDLFYYVPAPDKVYNRALAPSSITEKTNKPVACGKPFIVFSTPYFLEDFKQLGYETFSPYIDESYDTETDNYKRLNMIVAEIERIAKLSADEYKQLVDNCTSIAAKNLEKLRSKKDNVEYNSSFNFLKKYLEPQSNIQIL